MLVVSLQPPVLQVNVLGVTEAFSVQPVRGQNVPESQLCGIQNCTEMLHLFDTQEAPPEHCVELVHVHWPVPVSHAPDAQSAFCAQTAESAQLPPSGGYDAWSFALRSPIQTG